MSDGVLDMENPEEGLVSTNQLLKTLGLNKNQNNNNNRHKNNKKQHFSKKKYKR